MTIIRFDYNQYFIFKLLFQINFKDIFSFFKKVLNSLAIYIYLILVFL